MKVKAALLDERMVFQGMAEVEEEALTALHLPQITACDLPPGEYRWDAERQAFDALPRLQRVRGGAVSTEVAVAFVLLAQYARDPASLPEVALAWLDGMLASVDMGLAVYAQSPLVADYRAARALPGS